MQPSDSPPQPPPQTLVLEQPPGFGYENITIYLTRGKKRDEEHRCICSDFIGSCNGNYITICLEAKQIPVKICEVHYDQSVYRQKLYNCMVKNGKIILMCLEDYLNEMTRQLYTLLWENVVLGSSVTIRSDRQQDTQTILYKECGECRDEICVASLDVHILPIMTLRVKNVNQKNVICFFITCSRPDSSKVHVNLTNAIATLAYVKQLSGGLGPFQIVKMSDQFTITPDFFRRTPDLPPDLPKLLMIFNCSDSALVHSHAELIVYDCITVIKDLLCELKTNCDKIIKLITALMQKVQCNHDQIKNVLIPFVEMLGGNTTDLIKVKFRLNGTLKASFFSILTKFGILCGIFRKHGIESTFFSFMVWILQMILVKLSIFGEIEFDCVRDEILAITGIQKALTVPDFPVIPQEIQNFLSHGFRECYDEFKARSNIEIEIKERTDAKGTAASRSLVRAGGGAAVSHVVSAPAVVEPLPKVIEEPVCIICYDANQTHACVPCGHMQMCETCSNSVSICPTCKAPINLVIRVHKN